jgi:hypothetical protein
MNKNSTQKDIGKISKLVQKSLEPGIVQRSADGTVRVNVGKYLKTDEGRKQLEQFSKVSLGTN